MIRRILCMLLAVTALCMLLSVMATATQETAESPNAPYPQIAYDYTSEVQCGTIRYVGQIIGGKDYHSEYWKDWEWKRISGVYYGPGSECGTACMSMALSYVGVNKTPKDILDYGDGLTFFKDWEDASISKLSTSDLSTAVDNYINGNGRYSPPVIHLPNYSRRGHYVVVIGRIDGETYEILDPNNCAVTTMTVTGSTARYNLRGYNKTDQIDSLCQWFNPNAAPALIKTVYPSSCIVKVKEQIYAMSLPCGSEKNAESQTLRMLEKEQLLSTAELILNDWDEYWYKIQNPDKSFYYVPAGKVEYQQDNTAQITISDIKSPSFLEEGDYFSLNGKIASGNTRLTGVSVSVRKGEGMDGEVVTSGKAEMNSSSYDLAYSPLDSEVRFGKLTVGKYTYIIEAQYINYHINPDQTLGHTDGTVVLLQKGFEVEVAKDKNPPDKPILQISVEQETAEFLWEEVAHTTHYHLLLQKKNTDGDWVELETLRYTASGVTRTLPVGAYRAQVIASNENAWNNQSGDWHQTASDVTDFAILCEHVYADGVLTQEATCKDTGVISYTCTLCGEVKEETVEQLTTHTPGPAATATADQLCLICNAVLAEATGETEPTETEATEPSEPVEETQQEDDGVLVGNLVALAILASAAVGAVFYQKKCITQETQS